MKKTINKSITAFSLVIVMVITLFIPYFNLIGYTVSAHEYVCRGIDVSHHNGSINWNSVANSNVDFAIIRAGSTDVDGETLYKDRQFENNYSGAKNAGLKVGAYYYCGAYTQEGFERNAHDFLNILGDKTFDLPVYIDVEKALKQMALGKDTLTTYILSALDIISDAGYKAGIYANRDWFKNYLDESRIRDSGYEIWMAQFPSGKYAVDPAEYDKSSLCNIWQYSSLGAVNGINGNVDVDVSYVDYNYSDAFLTAPKIDVSVNEQIATISWDKVNNATHYDLRLYYADGRSLYDNWGGSPDELSLSFKMDPGDYKVQVCSADNNGNFTYCNLVYFTIGSQNDSNKSFEECSSVYVTEGVYYLTPLCVAPDEKCIDSQGGPNLSDNYDHNIHLWEYLGNSNQQFNIEYDGEKDGKKLYFIKNMLTNQYLISGDEHNVIEAPYKISSSKWYFIDCGNGYYKIINYFNNLALDVYNADTENGTNIWCYDPSDMTNAAQLFKLNSIN